MDAIQELPPPTNTPTEWSEVERPLVLQLTGVDWQIMSVGIDVPDLTERDNFRHVVHHDRPVNMNRTKGM